MANEDNIENQTDIQDEEADEVIDVIQETMDIPDGVYKGEIVESSHYFSNGKELFRIKVKIKGFPDVFVHYLPCPVRKYHPMGWAIYNLNRQGYTVGYSSLVGTEIEFGVEYKPYNGKMYTNLNWIRFVVK